MSSVLRGVRNRGGGEGGTGAGGAEPGAGRGQDRPSRCRAVTGLWVRVSQPLLVAFRGWVGGAGLDGRRWAALWEQGRWAESGVSPIHRDTNRTSLGCHRVKGHF